MTEDAPLSHEHRVLLAYLNANRNAVVAKCAGLTEVALRTPGVDSGTNLLGLVHHLTGVERHWFRFVFRGEDIVCDKSMEVPAELTADEVIVAYRTACAESDEIIRTCGDLSELSAIPNPGEEQRDPLRSIIVHMIEETARHAGHADILREQIDGATGL